MAVNTGFLRGRQQETYYTRSVAGNSNVTLLPEEAINKTHRYTGVLTGNIEVTFPVTTEDAGVSWWIDNATAGGNTLTVKGPVSVGIAVTQAKIALVQWNGVEFVQMSNDHPP